MLYQKPGSDEVLKVGAIGLGMRWHIAQLVNRPEIGGKLIAVADTDPVARARVRQEVGDGVQIVGNADELISCGIEAVVITTPDNTHVELACQFLGAGIAVYLEKPLAITTEGADRILATAMDTQTPLYVGHNMRHMAVVRQLKKIIDDGIIGEVKTIWCRHFVGNGGDYYFKDWHSQREHTNGLLLQKAAHDIDVIDWLCGSSAKNVVGMGDLMVYGDVDDRKYRKDELMTDWFSYDNWPPLTQKGLNPTIDVEDVSMLMMRMRNGVLATYQQCHFTPDYWRNYTIIGTEGRCENFGDGGDGVIKVWTHRRNYDSVGDIEYAIDGDTKGHGDADVLTMEEFIRFVKDGTPTKTTPLGAREAVAAAAAATESLRQGSIPLEIPELAEDIQQYFNNNQQSA